MALSIRIDRLTNSIADAETGESFATVVVPVNGTWIRRVRKAEWRFDWTRELAIPERQVFGLCVRGDERRIQGLISLEAFDDHTFAHLIESNRRNQGRSKEYVGVPGNLIAWGCQFSVDHGHGGELVFDSKTVLIDHYRKNIGAVVLFGKRMYIPAPQAAELIERHEGSWREES